MESHSPSGNAPQDDNGTLGRGFLLVQRNSGAAERQAGEGSGRSPTWESFLQGWGAQSLIVRSPFGGIGSLTAKLLVILCKEEEIFVIASSASGTFLPSGTIIGKSFPKLFQSVANPSDWLYFPPSGVHDDAGREKYTPETKIYHCRPPHWRTQPRATKEEKQTSVTCDVTKCVTHFICTLFSKKEQF